MMVDERGYYNLSESHQHRHSDSGVVGTLFIQLGQLQAKLMQSTKTTLGGLVS